MAEDTRLGAANASSASSTKINNHNMKDPVAAELREKSSLLSDDETDALPPRDELLNQV
jgi:hypothetical protein